MSEKTYDNIHYASIRKSWFGKAWKVRLYRGLAMPPIIVNADSVNLCGITLKFEKYGYVLIQQPIKIQDGKVTCVKYGYLSVTISSLLGDIDISIKECEM